MHILGVGQRLVSWKKRQEKVSDRRGSAMEEDGLVTLDSETGTGGVLGSGGLCDGCTEIGGGGDVVAVTHGERRGRRREKRGG